MQHVDIMDTHPAVLPAIQECHRIRATLPGGRDALSGVIHTQNGCYNPIGIK